MSNLLRAAAVISITTPLWYLPYRSVLLRCGYPRARSGGVQAATLIDWLNATGVGLFVGALLIGLAKVVTGAGQ